MRWKAQLVVLGLNGRIRRTPGYAGGYLFEGVIKASTGNCWWKFLVIKEVYVDIAHTTMIKYRKEW